MPTKVIDVVLDLDPKVAEGFHRHFLDNPLDVDLALLAPLFPRADFHQGHRQTPMVGPRVVSGKFPDIKVDVVPRLIFRKGKSVAVQDQAAGRGQEDGNGGLIQQALGMLFPLDNLHHEEPLHENRGGRQNHNHRGLKASGDIGGGPGKEHQEILRGRRGDMTGRCSLSSHHPIGTAARPLTTPARIMATLSGKGQFHARVSISWKR